MFTNQTVPVLTVTEDEIEGIRGCYNPEKRKG